MNPDLCTEEDVTHLVHTFYAHVRRDTMLGPIFESHVHDWDTHLAHLVDFWSAILRRTGRFSGAPMPRHAALPGLKAVHFQRWLGLWAATARTECPPPMAEQAVSAAERIAQSLWMGYQMQRQPGALPQELSHG